MWCDANAVDEAERVSRPTLPSLVSYLLLTSHLRIFKNISVLRLSFKVTDVSRSNSLVWCQTVIKEFEH